jgi:small subunit ribosomal protein S1
MPAESAAEAPEETARLADLSSLTAMLSAKWKQGASSAARTEPPRTGQVRTFRIVKIDAASKKIELELAG